RVPSAPPALADAAKPASTLVDLAREYVYERGAGAQSASRETENKPEFTAKPQRVATLDQPARIRSSRPGVSRSPAAAGEPPDAGGERQRSEERRVGKEYGSRGARCMSDTMKYVTAKIGDT